MVHHVFLDDAEAFLYQRLCKLCKVQPGCVIVSHSRGPLTLSMLNVGQSEMVYQFDFLGLLHDLIRYRSPQKKVVACKQI